MAASEKNCVASGSTVKVRATVVTLRSRTEAS